MSSTFIAQQDWALKIATRLDKPQNWKEVNDVTYSDTQIVVLPLVSTANEPAVTAGQFAAAADRSDVTKVVPFVSLTQTTETLSIVSTDIDNVYVDFADQAQSRYSNQMAVADLLGKKIGERVESLTLAQHAAWTNIGDDGSGNVALSSTNLTVTATNIDDIIRGIIQQIQAANGFALLQENGAFAIWRPQDWTALMTFAQANGFTTADNALQGSSMNANGGLVGIPYMGLYHYVSTLHTANHVMAGVRKTQKLGLLRSTFGSPYFVDHPASSTAGFLSGTSIYSRLDYGFKLPTNLAPVLFDVNVA